MPPVRTEFDRDYDYFTEKDHDAEELRAQARAERIAARRWCAECYHVGSHAFGCPEAPDPDEQAGVAAAGDDAA